MDLTQSFKKLYEAIPSIKFNGSRARYVDTDLDAYADHVEKSSVPRVFR